MDGNEDKRLEEDALEPACGWVKIFWAVLFVAYVCAGVAIFCCLQPHVQQCFLQ